MTTIKYATGRQYNGEQTLVIDFERHSDVDLFDMIPVTFTDHSRGIKGTTHLLACQLDNQSGIGPDVLREYDAGRFNVVD